MSAFSTLRSAWHRVVAGYRNIGSAVIQTAALVVAALLVSLIIVVPLWLAATQATGVYTVVVLSLAAAAIVAWIAGRIRRQSAGLFLPILKTVARVIAVVAGLYAMVVLVALGLVLPAVVLAIVGLLWLGYAASGGRTSRDANGAP
jgi:FtsH-binding integral membrane protein